jgi:hypothetical protein
MILRGKPKNSCLMFAIFNGLRNAIFMAVRHKLNGAPGPARTIVANMNLIAIPAISAAALLPD